MKRILVFSSLLIALSSCNNSNNTESKDVVDSLEERKDTLINNVDSTADAKIDSIKNKAEELKDRFDSSIEAKKDSIKN